MGQLRIFWKLNAEAALQSPGHHRLVGIHDPSYVSLLPG
jgi:hypothetical protein